MNPTIKKCRKLMKGATIAIIAPSGPFSEEAFHAGTEKIRSWGFNPAWRNDVFSRMGYLAGDDERRYTEISETLNNPSASALFCARGGYGAMRLLDRLDAVTIREKGKLLVGFSDATSLLLGNLQRAGLTGLHAPMPASEQFVKMPGDVEEWFLRLLVNENPPGLLPRFDTYSLSGGSGEGRIICGNLTIMMHLMAAGRMPEMKGAILMIEDVNEADYRIDRMITTLRLSGCLKDLHGIVLGQFAGIDPEILEDIVSDGTKELRIPIVARAPFGHGHINVPIPIGVAARLDANASKLDILESPVC